MSLPSPAELTNIDIEIESAHTPVPLGGFSGGSPTGEVNTTPGRKQREHKHSGRCFVTLKRKGARDVVRQTHARSASSGSIGGSCGCGGGGAGSSVGGNTPKVELNCSDFFSDSGGIGGGGSGGNGSESGGFGHDDLEADGPLCTAVHPPLPAPFRRASGSGSSSSRRGSGSGSASMASLEDAAQRIAVDPESGHSYFVQRSTVCDACPYCDDTCEVAWCNGCDERRAHLEDAYGPLMLSKAEEEAAGAGGAVAVDRSGSSGVTIGNASGITANAGEVRNSSAGTGGGGGSRLKLAPLLSRRYSRKSSYTPCEVRRRNLTGACWIVSQGSVYDVTAALADHPGGKRSVLRNAGGRDCAEDFHFHSRAAKKQWRQYRIGGLVACRGEMSEDGDGAERSMRTGSDCVIS